MVRPASAGMTAQHCMLMIGPYPWAPSRKNEGNQISKESHLLTEPGACAETAEASA